MPVYSSQAIMEKLNDFPQWKLISEAIERDFVFKNFSEALAFIVQIGIAAEKMNHHPEIFNVYNKVKIRLNTHSVQGITDLDFDLAKKIDAAFVKFQPV
ncbi:MAG: 4a-hydroxytetrahydrobiopterin dehydratase [Chitinophagaceae bacterium]|nr:4a-hydroxytetrahydrobiopterin dehydratase [Chitinophagaceae bacterium]